MEVENYDEVLRDLQHEELVKAVKSVTSAVSLLPKEDVELKKIMAENRDAINNFVQIATNFKKPDNESVIKAIQDLGDVMKGIGDRLTELETKEKPLPVKLKAERGRTGNIDYVIIEYKK